MLPWRRGQGEFAAVGRRDLVLAWRGARRRPVLATGLVGLFALATAALCLALAFFDATQVRPLAAVPAPEELVDVLMSPSREPGRRATPRRGDLAAWQREARSFRSFGAYGPPEWLDLTGAGEARLVKAVRVDAGYFEALGVEPREGRRFAPRNGAGPAPEAILSAVLARGLEAEAGGATVLGRAIRLDGQAWQVVGVMPSGLGVRGGVPDLWLPMEPLDRGNAGLPAAGLARLAPGQSLDAARQELDALARRLAVRPSAAGVEPPGDPADLDLPSLRPLAEVMVGGNRRLAWLLVAVALTLLLVAGLNAAGLAAARILDRRRDLAIRRSLGATRLAVARLVTVEFLALAVPGVLAGWALAVCLAPALPDLRGVLLYESVPFAVGAWTVTRGLGLGAAVALAAGLLTSASAFAPGRGEAPGAALRAAQVGETAPAARHQRHLLGAQIAATIGLLLVASLAVSAAWSIERRAIGFEPDGALAFDLHLSPAADGDVESTRRRLARLEQRWARIPGLLAIGWTHELPGGDWSYAARPAGAGDAEAVRAQFAFVSPGYRAALGVPLLEGRDFGVAEEIPARGAPPAAILSQSAAQRLFPGGAPLEGRILFDGVEHQVVGIVGDARRDPADAMQPAVWVAIGQHVATWRGIGGRRLTVVARAARPTGGSGDAVAWAATVRAATAELEPERPLVALGPLGARLDRERLRPRLALAVLVAFAAVSLVLCAVALGSALLESLGRRRREVGVRRACGARDMDVVRWVMRQAARPGLAGVVAGVPSGLLASGWVVHLLPEARLLSWGPYALMVATLLVTSVLALLVPIRRALRIEPSQALRPD